MSRTRRYSLLLILSILPLFYAVLLVTAPKNSRLEYLLGNLYFPVFLLFLLLWVISAVDLWRSGHQTSGRKLFWVACLMFGAVVAPTAYFLTEMLYSRRAETQDVG